MEISSLILGSQICESLKAAIKKPLRQRFKEEGLGSLKWGSVALRVHGHGDFKWSFMKLHAPS